MSITKKNSKKTGNLKDAISSPVSFPTRHHAAIAPPKKVIKALYDYDSQAPNELSFSQGDFFHVIGKENDPYWYEACNPATNMRGLVPVSYFQTLEKQERVINDTNSIPVSKADSGFGDSHGRQQAVATAGTGGGKGMQPLYGIVLYDFKAERPDELEAKAGEPIIVIAQSNLEWFVAKPIGRLGGPGLIPVSFVEIRDAVTGRTITNVSELMANPQAPIPKVEEWKKMTKGYEQNSIPLGQIEMTTPTAVRPERPQSSDFIKQSFDRNNDGKDYKQQQQQQQQQQYDEYDQASYDQNGSEPYENVYEGQHDDILSTYHDFGRTSVDSFTLPTDLAARAAAGEQPDDTHAQRNSNDHASVGIVSASVESFTFENEQYWFIVYVNLDSGRWRVLYRVYEDFYDFQITLLNAFPVEAGRSNGGRRILPYMPGPLSVVNETITAQRQIDLDVYVKDLCNLPVYIVRSPIVVDQLFGIRQGDVQVDYDPRASASSGDSSHQKDHSAIRTSISLRRSQSFSSNHSNPSTSVSLASAAGQSKTAPAPAISKSTSAAGQSIKIKIIHNDDIIAIRIPVDCPFSVLRDKVYDRIGTNATLRYKDERSGKQVPLRDEQDWADAVALSDPTGKMIISAN